MTDIPPAPPAPTPPPAAVSFTPEQQAEIDRIMGRTRDEGRRAGATEKQTELDAYLADQKAIADLEQLEGIEKAQAEAAAAAARADAAEATAAKVLADAAKKDALIEAGANPKTISDALLLLGDGDLDTTVPALAERLPALFTTDGQGTPPPPAGITPPRPPAGNSGGKTGVSAGADLYKTRNTAA